jgi:uncharacterized protein YaiI (UPF0178 family)
MQIDLTIFVRASACNYKTELELIIQEYGII